MGFRSLRDVQQEFNLNDVAPEELKKKLTEMMAEIHPDRHGGEFDTPAQKERYLRIQEAIDYVESMLSLGKQLVSIDQLPMLAELLKSSLMGPGAERAMEKESQLSSILTQQIGVSISRLKTRSLFPKVSLTSLSILLTAIWLFPSKLKDNPYLRDTLPLDDLLTRTLYLLVLALTAATWLYLLVREGHEKRFKLTLKLESVQNELFRLFSKTLRTGDKHPRYSAFAKDDFISFLSVYRERYRPLQWLSFRIDLELCTSLAESILSRLELREIISKSARKGLSDRYMLSYDFDSEYDY